MRFRPTRRVAATSLIAAVATATAGLVLAASPAVADDASNFSGSPIADGSPGTITVSGLPLSVLGAKGTLTLTPPGGAALPAYELDQALLATTATASVDPAALNPGVLYQAVATIGSTTFTCASCISISSDGPHITNISTPQLAQGQGVTDVTITGTHFHPGSTIDGGSNFIWKTTAQTGTTIKGAIEALQTATVGDQLLKVVNTDNKTASTTITVVAGPHVTTVNPTSLHRGTPAAVSITGTGLKNATLSIGDSTVGTVSGLTTTDTTMSATVTFNATNTPGIHGFLITATNNGTYVGRFTVTGELPTAPQNVKVTPGTSTMTISFSPPALDGGSPILDYTATLTSAAGTSTQTASASPIQVTGLIPGTKYAISLVARNITGTGPAAPTVKVTTKGTAPHIVLSLSKTSVTSGQKITLKGVLPAGQYAVGDLIIITSKIRSDKTSGLVASPLAQPGGRFSVIVQPYYDTCYTVASSRFSTTICAHVITVTKSIAVVRHGNRLTITAQVGPGVHITKSSPYRIALREVDSRGRVLKVLATVRPSDYRQAKGFGRLGANLVTFVITAPPSGTRLNMIAVHDQRSTAKASAIFIV